MTTDELWSQYLATGEAAVREQLIARYGPLVKYVVGRMTIASASILDTDDLLGFGTVGLLDAISRFDPATGRYRCSTGQARAAASATCQHSPSRCSAPAG